MKSYDDIFNKYGIKVPQILLPAEGTDKNKWAVIACDQYTSQRDYWKSVEKQTEGHPSTLNMIFPECYLEDGDGAERIAGINKTMNEYLESGVLSRAKKGFVLLKRDTPKTGNRWGLMTAIDLEQYDFSRDSSSLIRATEGTILDRIPPRVRIRENAVLELPHIMVLIDDPELSIIEPLTEKTGSFEKVYDFDLMMDSGHLTGYRIDSEEHLSAVAEALQELGSAENLQKRYDSKNPFLYAMGDGNHSLATAKTIWENYKKAHAGDPNLMEHPSRWALVEIVNIYSEGIEFEAIHRVLFDIDKDNFLSKLKAGGNFKLTPAENIGDIMKTVDNCIEGKQICGYCCEDGMGTIEALNPDSSIIAGTIQNFHR